MFTTGRSKAVVLVVLLCGHRTSCRQVHQVFYARCQASVVFCLMIVRVWHCRIIVLEEENGCLCPFVCNV